MTGKGKGMVGIQLSGGLGNQMFQYALYVKLRSLGKEVKIDDFTCYGPGTRPLQLDIFGLEWERMSPGEYIALTDSDLHFFSRVRRKIFGRRDHSYRETGSGYDPEVFRRDSVLLKGYFQSEKYFEGVEGEVRQAFRFRNLTLTEEGEGYKRRIRQTPSVAVHFRRGDYLDERHNWLYGGICDDGYYDRAMREMERRVPGAVFFFFSNDPEWVRAHYQPPGTESNRVVVRGAGEGDGYRDLYLMSLCKHQIIANSSFSWWGQWLNGNPEKHVIAPARWQNGSDCQDIYTKQMIRI